MLQSKPSLTALSGSFRKNSLSPNPTVCDMYQGGIGRILPKCVDFDLRPRKRFHRKFKTVVFWLQSVKYRITSNSQASSFFQSQQKTAASACTAPAAIPVGPPIHPASAMRESSCSRAAVDKKPNGIRMASFLLPVYCLWVACVRAESKISSLVLKQSNRAAVNSSRRHRTVVPYNKNCGFPVSLLHGLSFL